MDELQVITAAGACGINLDQKQAEMFIRYYHHLMAENLKYNLTHIDGEEAVLYEHFIDPLLGVSAAGGCPSNELLDLGSGAGFPGVPLKICFPRLQLYLLDSSLKKIKYLQKLARELELEEVHYLPVRAEEWGRGEGRQAYAWVTARAVAPLAVLTELALPLVKTGGFFWAFKGPAAGTELRGAEAIIARCGGTLRDTIDYLLPVVGKRRQILIFEKVQETEARFPRRAGLPQKKPFK